MKLNECQGLDDGKKEPLEDSRRERADQVSVFFGVLIIKDVFRSILNQTTDGNLVQAFKDFSLDPKTRYYYYLVHCAVSSYISI